MDSSLAKRHLSLLSLVPLLERTAASSSSSSCIKHPQWHYDGSICTRGYGEPRGTLYTTSEACCVDNFGSLMKCSIYDGCEMTIESESEEEVAAATESGPMESTTIFTSVPELATATVGKETNSDIALEEAAFEAANSASTVATATSVSNAATTVAASTTVTSATTQVSIPQTLRHQTLHPIADTWLEYNDTRTFGTKGRLKVDGVDPRVTLLKFDLSQIEGLKVNDIVGVSLKLYSLTDGPFGGKIDLLSEECNDWEEELISWVNAPDCAFRNTSNTVGQFEGKIEEYVWNEAAITFDFDALPALITLRVSSHRADGVSYASKEYVTAAPELVVYYTGSPVVRLPTDSPTRNPTGSPITPKPTTTTGQPTYKPPPLEPANLQANATITTSCKDSSWYYNGFTCLRDRQYNQGLQFITSHECCMENFGGLSSCTVYDGCDDKDTLDTMEPELSTHFNMRIFWKQGYNWQGKSGENEMCMTCKLNRCPKGSKVKITQCDKLDLRQHFFFDDGRIRSRRNAEVCLERQGRSIVLNNCSHSINQTWDTLKKGEPFQLRIPGDVEKCASQHHHPKDGEKVYMTSCKKSEIAQSDKWVTF